MLVQLSPFKTVETSLKISTSSRRRKRSEGHSSSDLPASVSFVTTSSRRGQLKWKQFSSEFSDNQPLLLVSADHEISIIGRSKEHLYEDISSLRYSSRPGSSGSFAPTDKCAEKLPRIPPLLDAKNDTVYALQHGNSRLCCWDALKVHGPDDKASIKTNLPKPAVSMALLPLHKGVVFGTLIDGSVFIARLDLGAGDQNELAVEYLPNKAEGKQGSEHKGTFAQLPQGEATKVGSRKRKMSDADGHTKVLFFQAFHDAKGLTIVRNEVFFERFSSSSGKMTVANSLEQKELHLPLTLHIGETVQEVQMLLPSSGHASSAVIMYVVEGSNGVFRRTFATLFSLNTGKLLDTRMELPSGTEQYSLIGETILAIGTATDISIFDVATGCTMHTTPLPSGCSTSQWRLLADSKFATLSIVYEDNGLICLALSSLLLGTAYDVLGKQKLTLASKLASAVADADVHSQTKMTPIVRNVLSPQHSAAIDSKKSPEDIVFEALSSLDDARLQILSPSSEELENYLFMDTYEGSVNAVLDGFKENVVSSDGSPQNPQDDDSQAIGTKNGGDFIAPKKMKNGLNGVHAAFVPRPKASTPSSLPQAFLDGAIQIVLKLLQCGKVENDVVGRRVSLARLDARIVLKQLLNTGKISARFHFSGSDSIRVADAEDRLLTVFRSIKLSNKRGRRCFSPVDMIMTMLRRCPDVSERQMVVMLTYMMRRALPEDIAEMFIDEHKHFLHNQYSALANDFFTVRSALCKTRKSIDPGTSPDLDRLSHKVIIAGTTYVLYRIVGYSQCNEAMLRLAMQDLLDENEAVILARCISNIFASTKKKDMISKAPPGVNAVKSICQWLAALCDTFHDELDAARVDQQSEKSHLMSLLEAVSLATKQSQEIISLKEDVRRVEAEIQSQIDADNASAVSTLPSPEELPGYSVQNLEF